MTDWSGFRTNETPADLVLSHPPSHILPHHHRTHNSHINNSTCNKMATQITDIPQPYGNNDDVALDTLQLKTI